MSGSIILKIGTEILNLLVFEGTREPTAYVRIFADKLYNEASLCQPSSSTQKAAYLQSTTFRSLTRRLQDLLVQAGGACVEGNTICSIANADVAAKEYVTRAIAANYQIDQPKVMDALAAYVMMVCAEGFKGSEVQPIMSGTVSSGNTYISANRYCGPPDTGKYH